MGNIINITQRPLDNHHNILGSITPTEFTSTMLKGFGSAEQTIYGALSSSTDMAVMMPSITGDKVIFRNETYSLTFSDFFLALGVVAQPSSFEYFLDHAEVLNQAISLLSQVSAQLAKRDLTTPASYSVHGTGHYTELRLRVNSLSMYWMLAIISLLILLTVTLSFVPHRGFISRDPGSVGSLAAILAPNPEFCGVLQHSKTPNLPELKSLLAKNSYATTIETSGQRIKFKIQTESHKSEEREDGSARREALTADQALFKWWQPWFLKVSSRVSLVGILVAIVIVLGVLGKLSKENDGLISATNEGYAIHLTSYTPALLMLIIRSLIESIGSWYRIILPYYELRHHPLRARHSLFINPLSQPIIQSFLQSISKSYWAITTTSLASLLAPWLVIVAGGLYSAQPVVSQVTVNLTRTSHFNSSFYANPNSMSLSGPYMGVQNTINMIQSLNMSFPLWTQHDLALEQLKVHPQDMDTSAGGNLTARVTAVRALMDCTEIMPSNLNMKFPDDSSQGWSQALVSWNNDPMAQRCPASNLTIPLPPQPYMSIGNITWLPYEKGQPDDCPVLMATYGLLNKTSPSGGIHVLACRVPVEQVEVEATFSLPEYSILNVISDDATVKPFTKLGNVHAYAHDFWALGNSLLIAEDLHSVQGPYGFGFESTTGNAYFDYTFRMIFALYPTLLSPDDLAPDLASADTSSHKITEALSRMTAMIHAQYINKAGRDVANNNLSETGHPLSGTIHQREFRVQQDAQSGYILQVLLITIALCITVSLISMSTKELLPFNPCSIATSASLLAGSQMLRGVPSGAEFLKKDSDIAGVGIFRSSHFSMGWWRDNRARPRFGIDVGTCSDLK
ncbi:hypothetical protein PG999_005641 [Apiospora kogelbergensis]|uniref:Uncharacterized protein n=1 Tax=Apiospora kogelbergensis TaxID=1337665 RepID=A0AAW0R2R7_9PEZI